MSLHRGFSLLEYILYIGLSALILVAVFRSTFLLIATRDKLAILQPLQEELRFTSRVLTRTIRNAVAIKTSESTFGSDPDGKLSLSMYNTPDITFSLQNGYINASEGGSVPFPLTSSKIIVEQMKFTNLSVAGTPGTIKLNLRARSTLPGATFSLETSTSLRQ